MIFTLNGTKQSIRRYLDADEYELLHDFEGNQEKIKDCIMRRLAQHGSNVDDMPYVIGLEADIALDLHKEYESIMKMYQQGEAAVPIRAFFGDLLERPRRTAFYLFKQPPHRDERFFYLLVITEPQDWKRNRLSPIFDAGEFPRQRNRIHKRIKEAGEVSEEEAISLIDDDTEELKKYL